MKRKKPFDKRRKKNDEHGSEEEGERETVRAKSLKTSRRCFAGGDRGKKRGKISCKKEKRGISLRKTPEGREMSEKKT